MDSNEQTPVTGHVMKLASRFGILTLCFGLSVFVGCGSQNSPQKTDEGLTRVRLALNWFPEAEHGGFYAAEVHGFFREEGLEVDIIPGGPGSPVIQQVATGRCEFAVANADQVLLGREEGAQVKAVLTAMQDTPRCIMVHQKSGITSLKELRGLTLAVGAGRPFAKYLLQQLKDPQLTLVPYQGNITRFLQEDNFAQQAYVFSEPFIARQQGSDPRCLMLSEIGFNPYASLLVTSDERVTRQADLVARMVRASRRGWQKYLNDPQPTNERIHRLNPEMSLDTLAFGAQELKALCLPAPMTSERLGQMSPERWQTLAQQLASIELVSPQLNWRQAFTLQFSEEPTEHSTPQD